MVMNHKIIIYLNKKCEKATRAFLLLSLLLVKTLAVNAADVWVEAESFADCGGWKVDQQFMDLMGSPYLLAHGLGTPVKDAVTSIDIHESGTYNVYVRTYNWTSPWSTKEGPGRFRLSVGKHRFQKELGTTGTEWMWERVGSVVLNKGKHTLTLHDITGFDGRCDAIYLTTDSVAAITNMDGATLAEYRRKMNNVSIDKCVPKYDFVVIGGGIAGMCAAVAASRLGLRVALVNDRPVLGGNNSSEVRVHLGGVIEIGANKGLGRMQREFGHSRAGNAKPANYYEDAKKDSFIRAEKNITLYANYHASRVVMDGDRISGVVITDVVKGREMLLTAPLFADCTGDGTVGFMAGADYLMGRESKDDYGESLAPIERDSMVMGASVQWYSKQLSHKTTFPVFEYGVEFNEDNCEDVYMGEWTWETGMNKNQIDDAERIRDYGLLVIYSNWSFLKNKKKDNKKFDRRSLDWVAYVAGKRESRRLLGDYVLKQDDIDKNVAHEDASFATTWSIDLHEPDKENSKYFPSKEFKSMTTHRFIHPYDVPYRCLYSRNVANLFMAGRCISTTHVALGTTRVMRTTGMMGEVVGMAASICHEHDAMPRDVYHHYLTELKNLMKKGVGEYDVPDNQRFNEPNVLLPKPKAFMEK